MKLKFTNLLLLGLALSILTGCHGINYHKTTDIPGSKSGKVGGETGVGPGSGSTFDSSAGTTGATTDLTTGGIPSGPGHAGWTEERKALEADTVYFDFDSSAIKDNQKSKIQAVADYLKGNSGNALKVEGHCDERGTEEYNRALGERRALAIREALVGMGITPDRVDTISYGEDKPAAEGNNEAAWSKNRRGEFIVLTPPK